MNPHVEWRLAIARQIAARIRPYEGIRAIVVGGSVARGYADAYSDLEMPLFWDDLPSDEVRKAIVADLGAKFLYGYDGPSNEDQLLIDGFQVDFWQCSVAHEETVFEDVLTRFDTDLGSSNFMDTIRACIPLHGEALIARWKERAQCYPDGLVVRNIQDSLRRLDRGHLEVHWRRDNPTMVYGTIGVLQEQVFLILLALNREYFPSFKWMYRSLAKMHVKPADIEHRFRGAYTCPQVEAIQDTLAVVEETLSLVEERYPQVDVTAMKRRLSMPRRAYDAPVVLWRYGGKNA
jgi:hypothetical protein